MKIAFNTLSENPFSPSGSLDYFREMAKLLPLFDDKNEYYFLCSTYSKGLFDFDHMNSKPTVIGSSNEARFKRLITEHVAIPIFLKKHNIDILFTSSSGGIAPLYLPKGTKLALGVFGTHHLKKELLDYRRRLYRQTMFKSSLRRASVVITNSNFTKKEILNTGFEGQEEVKVIYHGISHVLFHNSLITKGEMRLLADKNVSSPYILFASVIYKYKNVHTLVDGFGKFIEKNKTNHQLVLVGDFEGNAEKANAYRDELFSIANKYGVRDRLNFVGYLNKEQLRPFYCKADVYVQPSQYETFGKTVVEAMACGCPVIGANTSATPEIIGDSGILFDPNDPNDLSGCLERILLDDNLRNSYAYMGIQRSKLFSLEEEAMQLVDIFNKVGSKG